MVQSDENIWTRRFQLLLGLTLAGQIILGIVVYRIFAYSYARTELALTAFLLICGIVALASLQEPVARRIILGAGAFVLLALLALLTAPGSPGRAHIPAQPTETLRQFLSITALTIALVALLGKIVTDRAARNADMTYEPGNWFAGLTHLALAAIAAILLLLQISSGNQIRALPFGSVVYAGLSLNTVTILLLGAIIVFSLVSFSSALTWLDALMILILSISCALFQYTFGVEELTRLDPAIGQALISNINLVLTLVPLVLGVLAIFTQWSRFVAPLWLALQLVILQPFVSAARVATATATRARAAGALRTTPTASGQIVLYILAVALALLALRIILYWDRRRLNVVDGITIAVIALAVGLTAWTLGESGLHYTRGSFIIGSLPLIVYLIGICAILALALVCIHTFFSHSNPWLSRIESLVGILLTLSITLGALFLVNSGQGGYLAATTLNPHNLNPGLPRILLRNQYVLDGLFVILLLVYFFALVREGWSRAFGHTERALLLLSGLSCLLILASTGRGSVLAPVLANIARLGAYSRTAFTAQGVAATCLLIAVLISLLWLSLSRGAGNRIALGALFGAAALCMLAYYFSTLPLLVPCALLLLTAGTLIASRIEQVQEATQVLEPEDSGEVVHPVH